MKELDDGARVWRVSNDESERIDFEMVDGWIGFLDTLFIFAGLFSAVVATFVTQTTQYLQQDYSAVTASLLTEMVALQRATAIGGDVGSIPHSALSYNSTFTSTPRDVRLNGFWLASLSLTLVTALIAGIIKQWLHYYLADVTGGTPKDRACIRQYRYKGLTQWGVSGIIEVLPVLMNTSLLFFFLGLILFTQDLSGMTGTTWFLVGLTCISFVIYFGSSALPVWNAQCPYKTSLSKLYFSFLQLFWSILLHLFIKWNFRSSDIYIRNRSKLRHIAKVLMSRLSARIAELQAVKDREIVLWQNVITEMAINSTNPTVSEIAIQAMAALHVAQRDEFSIPLPLFGKLHDNFDGCFQYDFSNKYNFKITSSLQVVERYSRAVLLFDRHPYQLSKDDWNRILSFSIPLKDLPTAFFGACAMNKKKLPTKMLKPIIQCALDHPPIEVKKYPLHCRQFSKAIDAATLSDLYSVDEQKQLLVALVKRLSPQKALTLQEDLLIHYLYASRSAAVPVEEQALTKEPDSERSVDDVRTRATLLRFIKLLPDIADCAFSLGLEEQDRLLLYLLEMGFHEWIDGISMTWDEKWVKLNKDQPEFSSCVNSLIKLLNWLSSSYEGWSGNLLIRLKVIMMLHKALRSYVNCDEEVFHAMSHWLLVISLQGRDCPDNIDADERTRLKDDILESLFSYWFSLFPDDLPNDSLKAFCNFVVSKQLLGLPSVLFDRLSGYFAHLLIISKESTVFDHLDLLFRHFTQQNPFRANPNYPMTHEDQKATINCLINFTHKQRYNSTKCEVMLISWRQLVDDKNAESTQMENDSDSIYLQDVLWIFEEGNSNTQVDDPWDLQDVLWMFEKEIPLGAPLDFEWLRGQLDEALGEVIKPKVHYISDVARLFDGAPKDPYPPADDQGSKLY